MSPLYRLPLFFLLWLAASVTVLHAQWDPAGDEKLFSYVFPYPGRYINDHSLIRVDSLWHLYFIDGTPAKGIGIGGDDEHGLPGFGRASVIDPIGESGWDRSDNEIRIGHATSPDLLSWTPRDSALGVGDPTALDRSHVYAPNVIERNRTYYMFYTGNWRSYGDGEYLFLATSTDLYNWTRYQKEPIFSPDRSWAVYLPSGHANGPGGPLSGRDPHIHYDSRHGYILYYVVRLRSDSVGVPHGTYSAIAAATSPDLINWTDRGPIVIRQTYVKDDGFLWHHPESPTLVVRNGINYLVWKGGNGTRYLMSSDPLDFSGAEEHILATSHASEIIEWGERWYITSCSRDISDVYHRSSDRTRGLYLAQLEWSDSIPRVTRLDVDITLGLQTASGAGETATVVPNPVTRGSVASLRLPAESLPGEFDVRVFDIRRGEVVRDRLRSVVDQTGARIVEIPTAGLAPGVYFVRVGTRIARLVVI